MGKQKGLMRAKKHTIDYNEIGKALRRYCFNANDLSEDGPYGKTAQSLGWSNSRKNRKYLKLIWDSNRGNVQNLEEVGREQSDNILENSSKESHDLLQMDGKRSSKVTDKHKSSALKREKNTVDWLADEANIKEVSADRGRKSIKMPIKRLSLSREKQPIVISDDEFNEKPTNSDLPKTLTKSTRKLRKKKLPYTPISFKTKKEEYCICHRNYIDVDGGRMIECQNCQKWYHCSCLSLPTLPNEITGKHIQFRCGRLSCNEGVFMYKVNGKEVFPECCNKDENIFKKIAHSESKIQELENKSLEFAKVVEHFVGTKESFEFKKASEELTVFLLNLDKICTFGLGNLREKRKRVVNKIHSFIQLLEQNVMQNSSNDERNIHLLQKSDELSEKNTTPIMTELQNKDNVKMTPTNKKTSLLDNASTNMGLSEVKIETHKNMSNDSGTFSVHKDPVTTLDNTKFERLENKDILFETSINRDLEAVQCNDNDDPCNLKLDDIAEILNVKLPKYFSTNIPSQNSFKLSDEEFRHLNMSQNGRYYKKGHWQHIFSNGIAQSNQHCVFMYDMHQISSAHARKKKKNTPLFKCKGHCKFKDCSMKVYLEMVVPKIVHVNYSGNLKHKVTDQHARPIRFIQRESLKESFKDGAKPLKHFMKEFHKKDKEQIISGNCNNLGKDTQVFRQISSESRQIGRKDEDVIQSLLKTMKADKELGFGFIQKIAARPCTVQYWSEEGLRLYHALAGKDVLFWDATGSVVRKGEEGKRLLYYELALRHPVKGKMGIPVSAMLTDDQSLPSIQNWIARFRHDEKKLFGHSNTCQPKFIISDESWVFIIAALKEFNTETLKEFLHRTWNIALGKEPKIRNDKTIVHLCKSHFMQKVKRFCSLHYKRNLKFGLYFISLLLNSKDLSEAAEIFHDISVALLSQNITNENKQFFDRLLQKINAFDTSVTESCDIDDSGNRCDEAKPGFYTEEDFLSLAGFSPFKQWAHNISENAKGACLSKEKELKNPYYSEVFFQQIISRYMPIFPLWGSFILPTETKFEEGSIFNKGDICTTQGTIENRFRILKQISLGDKKNRRIDDFSEELKQHTVAIQRLVVKDTLKAPSQVKRKRSRTTIKESWNKKQKPLHIQDNGVFQKPPPKNIAVPTFENRHQSEEKMTANVCPIDNLGSTCWFNSIIQALSGCRMLEVLLSCMSIVEVEKDSFNKMKASFISLLKSIAENRQFKTKVPRQLLRKTLSDVAEYDGDLGRNVGQQHDANEFYVKVISPLVEEVGEQFHIEQIFTCIDCNYSNTILESHVNSLSLTIPAEQKSEVSLKSVLKCYFEPEIREKCQKCGGLLHLQQNLSKIPSTFVLTLNRFHFNPVTLTTAKIDRKVTIDRELDFAEFVQGAPNSRYVLKTVVCHHGRSVNSGHYTTSIVNNESLVNVSDTNINIGTENEMSKNAYVLFYDRQVSLDPVVKPLLKCLGATSAMTADSSLQNRFATADTYIPTILKNGDIDKAATLLKSSLVNCTSNNSVGILKTIFQHVFGSIKDAHLQSNAKNVLFYKVRIDNCKPCCFKEINTDQDFCILQPLSLSESDIFDCFLDPSKNCEDCKAPFLHSENYYCCLPKSIILCPQQQCPVNSKLVEIFDLDTSIKSAFPILSKEYRLSCLLVRHEETIKGIINCSSESSDNPLANLKDVDKTRIMAAFYDLKQKAASVKLMTNIRLTGNDYLPMRIPDKVFQKHCLNRTEELYPRRYPVSLEMAIGIAKNSHWMSSDDINCYMEVLCLRTTEDIHYVDAGWFSHKVMKDGLPSSTIFSLENRSCNWFAKSKILVPVNVQNVHWVLLVLDIREKVLYFCDPQGESPQLILLQISRYLSFEYIMRYGKKLDLSGWKYVEFCTQLDFPVQIDDSSCGIYVCELAKSIVFKRRIYPQQKLQQRMRAQVAREMYSGSIEF